MSIPDRHEPWCDRQQAPHALCLHQVAVIPVGTDVVVEVELRRALNVPATVVILVHRAGRVHTIVLNVEQAHQLGEAIDRAVRLLRPVG